MGESGGGTRLFFCVVLMGLTSKTGFHLDCHFLFSPQSVLWSALSVPGSYFLTYKK